MNDKLPRFNPVICTLFFFLGTLPRVCQAQLHVRGTIMCRHQGSDDALRPVGARGECVFVIIRDSPTPPVRPTPKGFFSIKLPTRFIDKDLSVEFHTWDGQIDERQIFISEEKLKNDGRKKIFKIEEIIRISKDCDCLKSDFKACQNEIAKHRQLNSDTTFIKNKAWLYTGTIAGFVASIFGRIYQFVGSTGPPAPADTILTIDSIRFPKVDLAELARSQFLFNGTYNGTNFAPRYNFERALFLNPSSLVFANNNTINLATNFSEPINFWQGSGFLPVTDRLGFGLGFVFLEQNEETFARLDGFDTHSELLVSQEYLGLASIAVKLNESWSAGLSAKHLNQNIDIPRENIVKAVTEKNVTIQKSFDTTERDDSHTDFDISATFNPSQSIRTGIILSNILGSKLTSQTGNFVNIRSVGLGVSFKKQRLLVGSDLLITAKTKVDIAFGINYIANNHFTFNTSYLTADETFQIGSTLKFSLFRLNYSFSYNSNFNESHLVGLSFIL